jgi:predicted GIY-YIG superfamily endonuclease
MKTALYRHYAKDGALLYVGITREPFQRWSNHTNKSSWAQEVIRIDLEWFARWEDAYSAECEAILSEDPIHNIRRPGRTLQHRGRPSRGPQIVAMFEDGMTPRQIAKTFAMSTQGVYNHLKESGYEAPYVTNDYSRRVLTRADLVTA